MQGGTAFFSLVFMEGPSINILVEEVKSFRKQKIESVKGIVTTIDIVELTGKDVKAFKSWGKHFLICFDKFYLRVHFLMFGSYTVNTPKDRPSKLSITFSNGTLHLYTCSIQKHPGKPEKNYDWSSDLMSKKWDPALTVSRMKKFKEHQIADVLLDQNIFSGSGNIIKNETLFWLQIHPERLISSFTHKQLSEISTRTRDYCYNFFIWKKAYTLKKHWKIYGKKKCLECGTDVLKKPTGLTKRRSFFCPNCQK